MDTRLTRRRALAGMGAAAFVIGSPSLLKAQAPITLNGAVQFNDDHAFTKALVRFEERVKALYGKPIAFNLHKNSSLGLEKQYFEYMAQGRAVDYGIVSPAHMSTFARAAPFIDAPFVFRDVDHMGKVVAAKMLKPIEDEVERRAGVRLVGHAGGARATSSPTSRSRTSRRSAASRSVCRARRSGRAPSPRSACRRRSSPTTRSTTPSRTA